MSNPNQTTRTCIICGEKKSLTAFLELAGSKIHSYGDICSTCRGSGLTTPKVREKEPGEKSGGSTRAQLDNKMRMKTEQERILLHKNKEALDHEEKSKKDELVAEKEEKEEQHEDLERKDREENITTKNPEVSADKKIVAQSQKFRSFLQERVVGEQKQAITTATNQQTVNQQETKKTTNDLSVTYLDEQANTVKRSGSSVFAQFRKALGKSAAINRALEVYGQKNEEKAKTKHSPGFLQEKTAQPKSPEKDNNPAKDFINNNMKRR